MLPNYFSFKTDIALKEWSLVCQALGHGDQSLLLRKGGLIERKGGFAFEHQKFLLFPTWFHGELEKIHPRYHSQKLSSLHPASDTLRLEYVVSVERGDFIASYQKIAQLSELHILKDSVLKERFYYCNAQESKPGIHVAFLRVYRLDAPLELKMEKRWGGCRSWIHLPEITTSRALPILSEEEHSRRRSFFDSILEE